MDDEFDAKMATVAEYGTRFDADVASAHLTEYGIQSAVFGDPAHSVAPHHVTNPGFQLMVLGIEVDDAKAVLGLDKPEAELSETAELEASLYHRHFSQRPRWIRWSTYVLLAAVPIPLAIAFGLLVWELGTRLFP